MHYLGESQQLSPIITKLDPLLSISKVRNDETTTTQYQIHLACKVDLKG